MISFIYFDVGGVVLDDFSDNDKWQQLKQELGISPTNDAAFTALWDQYAPELCTTRNVETLMPILRQQLGLQLPDNYSLLAGFVDRFTSNPSIWPIIEATKQKTRIGLLTNMYPGMFAAIKKRGILPDITWDVIMDSSVECLQKPNKDFLELAQKRANALGKEILFIDNGSEHIQAAKEFGWQTFLYDSADHLGASKELERFLGSQQFAPYN
jgi:FMN phosphatase YigB (HAD superfamily)